MSWVFPVGFGVLAAALAAALAIVIRRNRRRVLRLEVRAARAEREAGRAFDERLRVLRQRLGLLYLDGLPLSGSRRLQGLFAEGVGHAARNHWDRAADSWQAALKHGRDNEQVALHLLVGACRLLVGRLAEARVAFDAGLLLARSARDRYGVAAAMSASGMLAREEKRHVDALEAFGRVAVLWGALGEMREQARALRWAAQVHEARGDTEQAIAGHRKALRIAEQAGDAFGAVRQYATVGRLLARRGDIDAAHAACEGGLVLARKVGHRGGEVELLAAVGELLLRQRVYDKAVGVLERALRLRGELGGRDRGPRRKPVPEARILFGLARASEGLGRIDVAGEYYERAAVRAVEENLEGLRANCLAGLARGARHHGAFDNANSLLTQALELDRSVDNRPQLGRHLVERAVLALEMHDPAGASRDLEEAGRCTEADEDKDLALRVGLAQVRALTKGGRHAEALVRLRSLPEPGPATDPELAADRHFEAGHVVRAQGAAGEALAEWRKAVEGYRQSGVSDARARATMYLAEALAEAGHMAQAADAADEALRETSRHGTRKDEVRALRAAAFVEAKRGRTRNARLILDRAVELARTNQDRWSEAAALLALGRLAREVEVFDAARDNLLAARRLYGELGAAARVVEIDREMEELPRADTGVQFLDRGH